MLVRDAESRREKYRCRQSLVDNEKENRKEEIFKEKDDTIQVLYLCEGQHKPQSAFG